jgi:hypothetical protein
MVSHRGTHANGRGHGCGYAHVRWSGCVNGHGRGCESGHGRGRVTQYESGGYACCTCSVCYECSGYGCDRGLV